MNKFINLKNIFIFLLGGILFSGITAYAAYKIHAREVSYTPENESFQVENVNSALDSLYEKTQSSQLKLLNAENGMYPQNPVTDKYSDSMTYTAEESGDLLFSVVVNVSGYLAVASNDVTTTNSNSKVTLMGSSNNWTMTSETGSYAPNYIYTVKNVSKGDQITLSVSARPLSGITKHNSIVLSYQVYKIG